jgi:hypothetical protein
VPKVILTCDRHLLGSNEYSFLILDLEKNQVVDAGPHTDLLQAKIDAGSRRIPFRPFGITQSEDKIFIASNQNIASFDKDTLEPIELVSDSGVPNTHQILYRDGYIYRTNTANDTISRIDITDNTEIHFSFKQMDRVSQIEKIGAVESDNHHINSLLIHDESLYVILHNMSVTNSELFKISLDFSSYESIAKLGYSHHEIVIVGRALYSLASATGDLLELDLDTLEIKAYHLADEMFLRGMVLVDNKLEIFASRRKDALGRDLHAFRITFDLDTKIITKLPLPEIAIVTCAQIYDR